MPRDRLISDMKRLGVARVLGKSAPRSVERSYVERVAYSAVQAGEI